MKREFLINISFLILINLLIKPFYILFIETRVQDTLGPNVYGLYFGIFNIAFILQILADLGIQNFNSRTIARKPELLKDYLPNLMGIKLILSVVYLLIGILFAAVFGYLADSFSLFILISLNLVLLSFILYLRTNIAASGHYRLDSFLSVLDKVLLIIFLSFLLFHPSIASSFNLYSFVYAQTVSFVIVLSVVLIINFRLAGILRISFDMKFARRILKQSLPFSLIVILMSLYMRMDGFMLEQMLDDDAYQAGVYAASFRVYEAYNMIGYLFAVLLLPMFASLLSDRKKLLNLMTSSHNLILSVAGVLVVATFLFRQEIMLFLYPLNANSYYGELLGLHLLSFFAICLSYIYGTFLTANNNLTRLNKLLFTGVLINLTLNLLFIPTLGAKGAAYSTIFTQFFVLGGQYLLSLFELKLKIKYSLLLKRLLFIISIVVVGILFQNYVDLPGWISSFILLSIVFVAIALSFGFVNLKDLFNKEIE